MVIYNLKKWLQVNKHEFNCSITKTSCYKWGRWHKDNSIHLFPCVCPTRNKECIFIETYFEVQKAFLLIQKEQEYSEALEQYHKVKQNQNAVFEWINFYESLGSELLHFNPIIKIKIRQEPYEVKQIGLPESGFQTLLKFKNIFTENYYSEQYENY